MSQEAQIFIEDFLSAPEKFKNEARHMVVVFTDLVGSTEFKRNNPPIDGVAKTVLHNRIAEKAVVKQHGIVRKHLGDGVLATFEGGDAERLAIQAGIDIIKGVEQESIKRGLQYPKDIRTRVGIEAGPVWLFEVLGVKVGDPQGLTVDIAHRLASLAGQQQVVCTDETYQATNEKESWSVSDVQERTVRGVDARLKLRVIQPPGGKFGPLPFLRVHEVPEELKETLVNAHTFWRDKKYEEALPLFETIAEKDPDNFEAHIRVGELLLQLHATSRLEDAIDHLCIAKWINPQGPVVFLRLAWARYREFELRKNPKDALDTAINYATEAIQRSIEHMDVASQSQARSLLARLLLERVDLGLGNKDEQIKEAIELCDAMAEFTDALKIHHADYLITRALAHFLAGSQKPEIIDSWLDQAFGLDKENGRVHLARFRISEARYGSGGHGQALQG